MGAGSVASEVPSFVVKISSGDKSTGSCTWFLKAEIIFCICNEISTDNFWRVDRKVSVHRRAEGTYSSHFFTFYSARMSLSSANVLYVGILLVSSLTSAVSYAWLLCMGLMSPRRLRLVCCLLLEYLKSPISYVGGLVFYSLSFPSSWLLHCVPRASTAIHHRTKQDMVTTDVEPPSQGDLRVTITPGLYYNHGTVNINLLH